MTIKIRFSILFLFALVCLVFGRVMPTHAQQTLGGITGQVTDTSGGALPDTTVTLVGDQTQLTRTVSADATGVYSFVDLPIGNYSLKYTHDGFQSQSIPGILVQANRTATVNATLKVGAVTETVTVEETPMTNAVDTTNGYVLDTSQLDSVPLPTGSFTSLAILSPGVNAELESGTGANNGLGNQPIWANGQRDTSNTFLLNGVDASNLFNGKSTSSVDSARVVNNTGIAGASASSGEPIQSTASPYLAIGQALPTPAQETLSEVRVNTSMYDAQEGGTSGAHIDLSTASGTNQYHGMLYGHRGTDAWNATPYFNGQNGNIPDADKVPQLHRYTAGGTFGGPIIKNKVFGFVGYQHVHSSDQEIGTDRTLVPPTLTTDRSVNGIVNAAQQTTGTSADGTPCTSDAPCQYFDNAISPTIGTGAGEINPIAYTLLNYPGSPGGLLFPSADEPVNTAVRGFIASGDQSFPKGSFIPSVEFPEDVYLTNKALFVSDQAVANMDILATSKDTLALKYYYQHDPTTSPYAYSSMSGFNQHLDAGSQVASITNTQLLKPNLSVVEVMGFIREKAYSTIQQPFTMAQFTQKCESLTEASAADCTINTFGSPYFPGISIVDDFGNFAPYNTGGVFAAGTTIGMGGASQGAFTGAFQNRWMPSANAILTLGKHTITFGGSFTYTQLNTRDERPGKGMIGFADFSQFLEGITQSYTTDGYVTTAWMQGSANRYWRANDTGEYIEDKYQFKPNLSVTAGVRLDYHGGMTEKNERLFNFNPADYSYAKYLDDDDPVASNYGFELAGKNGVSDSTLNGRQWGLAPRIGVAWSPKMFSNKVVVRAGWGMYYDRGELFTYLSPGFAAGVIAGGPFGVNQSPPYVSTQVCTDVQGTTCNPATAGNNPNLGIFGSNFENPWGSEPGPGPTNNASSIAMPTAAQIAPSDGSLGAPLFTFAVYNRNNKLPYTLNQTLDIQWQPRNDIAIEVGYVGNLGRHEVVPVPFNQAQIATPAHPINGQSYTYGYQVQGGGGCNPTTNLAACNSDPNCSYALETESDCVPIGLPDGTTMLNSYEGGNVDLRVPYVGFSSESLSYTAAGISGYNALQAHVEKRLSHGVQIGFSYTYSHSLDEQSGLGLFYTGNNAEDLRSGYGNSDFDRTNVINFDYLFRLHNFAPESWMLGKFVDGWALQGLTVIQSGQPYSVVDYSGAVGSVYYGVSDGVTNPIVPLAPGCTPKNALTGLTGAQPGTSALKTDCFTIPSTLPSADSANGIPAGDIYETTFITKGQRNIFRQSWQRNANLSVVKQTKLTERFAAKYTFDVFNLTNTPSFDIPLVNVDQNLFFNGFPQYGTPTGPQDFSTFYQSATFSGFGLVNKTIGSMRQIQMSLSLTF
jgi:hypothetical protein